jgi:prepilin-type N-terminal cleavage/methylation domain-containing protein
MASKQKGFSLIELLVVMAIALIIAGYAAINLQQGLKNARIANAYDTLISELRNGRELAVDRRQTSRVTFTAPNTITTATKDVGLATYTTQRTITIGNDLQFQCILGIPNTATTVPDGFGAGATAIDFNGGAVVNFQPDGTAVDGTGAPANGVVYIARTGDIASSRAVTLFGSTGRLKGWRLQKNGATWTWVKY